MRKYKPTERIYRAFYDSRESRLYFSQIQELSGLSGGSLVNALRQLEATKEVQVTRNKAHTFYALRNRDMAALHFTRFDYEKLGSLSNRVRVPIRQFVTELPQGICFALLFGSAARKQERQGSDIDILLVLYNFSNPKLQEEYEIEIKIEADKVQKRITATSVYPIRIVYATVADFLKDEDRLIAEARNTGFCIAGNLEYYEVSLNE
jgi:predicted nucleotidyltransferase